VVTPAAAVAAPVVAVVMVVMVVPAVVPLVVPAAGVAVMALGEMGTAAVVTGPPEKVRQQV